MKTHPSVIRRVAGAFGAAALLLAAGCASAPPPTTAMLTYETVPEGATLYEGGQAIGTAPVTRTYKGDGKSDTIRTPDVTAVWPSGAKESYYTLLKLGSDRVATIERPKSAPGLQADLEHAKKFAEVRDAESRRIKEQMRREQARNSERCRRAAAGAALSSADDCSAL